MSDVRLKRLGIPDRFIEHGRKETLLRKIGLDTEGIAKGVRKFLQGETTVV
jgi:1-deoxy-D-xylulose-5-phosphate synthase